MSEIRPVADTSELRNRALWAAVLGFIAVFCVFSGGLLFNLLLAAVAVASAREWHRLVGGGAWMVEAAMTLAAIVAALVVLEYYGFELATAALFVGAVVVGIAAGLRRGLGVWHGFGVLYLGIPVVAGVILREDVPRGAAVVAGVLIAVWAADTGAWFFGKRIGGPKLAPVLSPNKTWAGFIGGTLTAGLCEALYVVFFGSAALEGLIAGIVLGLAGHAGDLFESWVKRCFQAKNMGSLIPGHGGMLDRIDSLLFAVPAAALLVVGIGMNPLLNPAQ